MSAHPVQHNVRFTEEEWNQIDLVYCHSMVDRDQSCTKSSFIREIIMTVVARKLKKIEE